MSRSLSLRSIFVLLTLCGAIPAFASRPYVVEERAVSKRKMESRDHSSDGFVHGDEQ